MALVKCKECGNQVSTKANSCPACGAKIKKRVGVIGWLFVIFFVLPFAWSIGTQMSKNDPAKSEGGSGIATAQKPTAAPGEPVKKWIKTELKDAMTDEKTVVASTESKNATQFEFPYQKAGGSRLSLSFRRSGNDFDAYLRIDRGQMQCHYSACGFSLRIGDGPVQKWTGLPTTTHDRDMMFVRDAKQLETIVKSGKPFRIGIEFFQAGERVFEFDPAGYPGT
ncbi:hypothetical protein D9M69_355740 [compost metagenome]